MSLAHELKHLPLASRLFEELSAGKHLHAGQDPELWHALSGDHADAYVLLFAHLGKKLVRNARGYAYFEVEDMDAPGTRSLALLYLLIFQKQADAGMELHRFDGWLLDARFLEELRQKNPDLLRSEKLDADETWKKLLNRAVRLGFLAREGTAFRLLPATWRFLDLFLELERERAESGSENLDEDDAGPVEAGASESSDPSEVLDSESEEDEA
jgi:hypothetical protein